MRPAVQYHEAINEATPIDVAAADGMCQPIALDLHPALAMLGYYDGVYVVISDVPVGARLSAGRSNGNFTWSLLPAELENLSLVMPWSHSDVTLTASIVTPDPDGYEFASTSAQFNIIVADGISTVPLSSLRRIESLYHEDRREQGQRTGKVRRSRLESILGDDLRLDHADPPQTDGSAPAAPRQPDPMAETTLLATARLEWRADEEARMARARERWEAEAEHLWVRRSAEMAERHARELREAEARWHTRDLERVAVTEAMWSARLAAQEVAWRSDESSRFAAALARCRAERLRRAAAWFVFSLTIGSMMLA